MFTKIIGWLNPTVLIVVALAFATLSGYATLEHAWRLNAEKDLQLYKSDVDIAMGKQMRENQIADARLNKTITDIQKNHSAIIEGITNDYETKLNLKDRDIATVRNDVRNSLLRQIAVNSSATPKDTTNTKEPTEVGSNSNATVAQEVYDNLEFACAITTADYNALYDYSEGVCNTYGCEE